MQCRMERDIYFLRFPENQLVPNDDSSSIDLPLCLEGLRGRAVASFFVAGVGGGGGHYRKCRRHKPCRGVCGYPPQEDFQIWRLWNTIFSTCHEICLQKIHLEYGNGKQLQVTIIKITESKENKSIHRLNVSGSTGLGGGGAAAASLAPLLAMAQTGLILEGLTQTVSSDWESMET